MNQNVIGQETGHVVAGGAIAATGTQDNVYNEAGVVPWDGCNCPTYDLRLYLVRSLSSAPSPFYQNPQSSLPFLIVMILRNGGGFNYTLEFTNTSATLNIISAEQGTSAT